MFEKSKSNYSRKSSIIVFLIYFLCLFNFIFFLDWGMALQAVPFFVWLHFFHKIQLTIIYHIHIKPTHQNKKAGTN